MWTTLTKRLHLHGLWRHPNFLALWAGQSISVFGSAIGALALSLTAAVTLGATPTQMGVLQAVGWAPSLLALFAGVWVDRWPRRPLLIGADVARAVLLLIIPLVLAAGVRRIEVVYVVAVLVGVASIVFNVAYQAFLPAVVAREQLVEANSKLTISASAAAIAGPSVAGILIQLITAPIAILIDAASFALSAACVANVRSTQAVPQTQRQRRSIWQEIGDGLQLVARNPYLRAIAGYNSTASLFWSMQLAVFVLYLTRELQLSAAILGIVYASLNVGTLVAPLAAQRLARRFGLGRTIAGAPMLSYIGAALLPLALGAGRATIGLLIVGQFLIGFGLVVYEINQVSLRQAVTPDQLLGRMSASMRFLTWLFTPAGALLGGALGEAIGLQPTLLLAAGGLWLTVPWVVFSPLRTLVAAPASASAEVERSDSR